MLRLERELYPEAVEHPETRAECCDGVRPCPYVGCAYNLYLDVNEETGSIKYNHPGVAPEDVKGESCALDIAERGTSTLEEVAEHMNMTRERIRQIEEAVLAQLGKDRALARCDEA